MTLDEAIKHAEEVASRKFDDNVHCIKCAEEHRQLAEWLKDYKRLKEQEPKTGHWIKKEDDTCWWYACSECEQEPLKNRWNDDDVLSTFCPNCGAKMESEDKE